MAKEMKKTASAVMELKDVGRWYGEGETRVEVLTGVNLTIPAGKSVAIVGPSGSGKSTLLHVAGLLDRPDDGTVMVQGLQVMGSRVAKSDDEISHLRNEVCGFVYQFHHLLREFTALENVFLPMTIGGKKPDKARAEALLKAVGLGHRMHHTPSQMSGGEQQRVAIARALMNKPQLLLADEPTGNLDPHTADEVMAMLFGLIADEGMSALIVTHNMDLAEKCDFVYRMENGVLARA